MPDLRYPVGKFASPEKVTEEDRRKFMEQIGEAPIKLRAAVQGLSDQQLDTSYREGGWTVRQVVHHLADSHLNAYVRFRLALTEERPTVKTYDQERWAQLTDARTADAEISLRLLESLHQRWVLLLKSLTASDLTRSMQHPELGIVTLERYLALYAWHGRHHVAHITSLRDRMGWK